MKREIGAQGYFIFILAMMLIPCGISNAETFTKPLQGWRIMIDPGTGGDLVQGPFIEETKKKLGGFEADVNMRIALFLSDSLEKAGAEIGFTRESTDVKNPTIDDRLNKSEAFKANLIISIHHDYSEDSKDNYVKGYCYPPEQTPDKSIALHIVESLKNELGLPSKGVESYAHPFLARSQAPCVMISCGCASNTKYQKSLKDISFNLTQARGILKGMMAFQEESSKIDTSQPPLAVVEKRSPLAAPPASSFSVPIPPVPESPPPVPKPVQETTVAKRLPIEEVRVPEVSQTASEYIKEFKPPFLNPLGANFDQSWLFGETWGSLPTRQGNSFAAPEGSDVKAAEEGVVIEVITTPGQTGVQHPNSVVIEHRNIMPDAPLIYTIYAKLAEMKVKTGDRVKRGQVIGIAGVPSSTTDSSRDTEIEFQIRMGDLSESSVVNPELFTRHVSNNTGVIAGQLINKNGQMLSGVRIDGAAKTPEIERYLYSLTYAIGVPPSKQYNENFAIGDVPEGEYYLSCEYGTKKVEVEKGKISFIVWQVE
ncbi:N-acetylmuramoyl-L-alanine amidase [Candidatus Sumerlaeota bacterium]|nr:N-acetylmuramoyl-L-alanine amidase [Candidatus Sumerlaeota bacterium]